MTRRALLLSLLLYLLASLLPPSAPAQVATGTPPFGSFGGRPDVIDLANLNSHLPIPVVRKPGRGMDFSYDVGYDSSVWSPVGASGSQTWQPSPTWGWNKLYHIGTAYLTNTIFVEGPAPCNPPGDWSSNAVYVYQNWVLVDDSGAHSFPGVSFYDPRPECPNPTPQNSGLTAVASDGSGYTLSVSGFSGPGSSGVVTTKDGKTLILPIDPTTGPQNWTITDRNGNQVTSSGSGALTDTLGYTAVSSNGTAPSNVTLSYSAPSGATANFVARFSTYSIQTNFGCNGISEYGANGTTTASLVSELDLPDGSKYTLGYEQTPGHSGFVTGRPASVTLPTGGTITYSYSGGNNGINCSDGSTATLTRATPDGNWIYTTTKGSGVASTTTVTDPQNNQTVLQFQGIYQTQRQVYQGSSSMGTLLQTTYTCYNGSSSPCTGTAVNSPINQKSVTTILPGSQNLQSKTNTLYNSQGNVTETDEYDFGSGAPPSTPLRKTLITYASLGNNITNMPSSVIVEDGSNSVKAQTIYCYDEATPSNTTTCGSTGSPTATSGTPQHTTVYGSRGNATSIHFFTGASTYLTKKMTYFDTGNVQTATDVNNGQTTYTYGACGNSFATSVTEAVSPLSTSMTWNCTGAVQLTSVDENTQTTTTAYTDAYFWRPASVTDPTSVVANTSYNGPNSVESTLSINSNSVVDTLTTLDGLGRSQLSQTRQAPGSANFDTVEQDYDNVGRPSRGTVPYSGTSGHTNPTAPAVSTTYDALSRPLTVTDAGGGTVTYSYNQNDVLVTVGPAPSGEHTKSRQLEYDGLGRLTSVCEITSATGSGTCGQNNSQTAFWTKYTYDLNNNLISVTQNAQAASGSQQTRSYVYDFLSRLTSETNPENGTTTYTYDSASGCTGTYNGDLVKKVDALGNLTCLTYDALHRKLSATYPSGTYASVTPSKYFVYDSATVNSVAMANAKGRLAEAYTCTTCPGTKLTDIGYSYTVRGEVSDVYESTPHSGGYYHLTQSYWAHGSPNVLSGLPGLPTITYGGTIGSAVGLDGEGRVTQITAGTGQNPVTGVTYNTSSLPTQVNFGSGDNDIFAYDSNTLRMTQFKFNVGTQSKYYNGVLTWNANSSLSQLAITDQYNSPDTQTCNYTHDDLVRIATANCGTAANQSFSYDAFGNISKSGSPYSFQPTYTTNPPTNRFATIPGTTPSYDANGNVLSDGSHTYAWDSDGNSITVDSVSLTFDALDRMVEQNRSGTYTQIVYAPTGDKLALMNGSSLTKAFVPLPGQATAVYTSSGLDHYRHSDWLGSARLTSSPSQTYLSSVAYAPFGETYASSGTTDVSFTGMNSDTVSSDYDFLYRPYSTEGRWPTPDPVGLAAVDPSIPQSWNRYAYVLNNPLSLVDPKGLYCYYGDTSEGSEDWLLNSQYDFHSSQSECEDTQGVWFPDPNPYDWVQVNADPLPDGGNSSWWGDFAKSFFTTNPFPAAWESLKSETGCGHIIAETFLSDLSPVPVEATPSLGDAIPFAGKATAAAGLARASAYSLSRGLVQPLKSGTYRALRGGAIVASDAVEEAALPATIVYAGGHALVKSISAAAGGECR